MPRGGAARRGERAGDGRPLPWPQSGRPQWLVTDLRDRGARTRSEISWRTIPSRLHNDSTIWTITVEPEGPGGSRIVQRYDVVKLSALMDRMIYQFVPVHREPTRGAHR